MKLKSKLIGINIFGQTVFAVIFFTALYFSYTAITEKIYRSSLVERYADDALDTYIILHLAESGDIEGAKASLNLKLDNYVYEIHHLSAGGIDEGELKVTDTLLRKVSKHREAFPREAGNVLQRDVDAILADFRE